MDTLSFSFQELAHFVDLKHIKVLELKFRGQVFYSHVKGKFKKTRVQQNGSALHRFH
jgi:hypothetical protein